MQSVRQSGASVCALRPQVPPGGAGRHGHQGQGQCQMTGSRVHPKVKGSSKDQAEDADGMRCRVKREPALNMAVTVGGSGTGLMVDVTLWGGV